MNGLAKKTTERQAIIRAMKTPPPGGFYVRDGKNEDDRPAMAVELQVGLQDAEVARQKRRGRPMSAVTKEQVAIRFDRDVLAALRATGPGWQTRVNEAMREWVKAHSV